MAVVAVRIKGISPLLTRRFGEQEENEDATRPTLPPPVDRREVAEASCYRDLGGDCYFPAQAIGRMLREAGASHKMKGTRKTVKYVVPAAVIMCSDEVLIRDEKGKPFTTFEVDSRPVTIPATKGRIMRHRPRWDSWTAEFEMEIDPTVLPVELIHQLLEEGGRRIGIGDFRPEKGGPFGRFEVTSWEVLEAVGHA